MNEKLAISIRTETAQDFEAVYRLNYAAFGNREDESLLVERIRTSSRFIPELSLVAEMDNEIVGHLLLSGATVEDGDRIADVLVLAPVAVRSDCQRQGIGSRLIEEGIRRGKTLGYGLILLIGHPEYYPKLGFRPAREHGLELTQFEVPDDVFMVYEAEAGALGAIRGELKYPPAFFGA